MSYMCSLKNRQLLRHDHRSRGVRGCKYANRHISTANTANEDKLVFPNMCDQKSSECFWSGKKLQQLDDNQLVEHTNWMFT